MTGGVGELTHWPIEQGPEWLVDLYFSPPAWANPALKLLAAVVLLVAAYRVYQAGGIPIDKQREMQTITAWVVVPMIAVLGMVNLLQAPYAVDVGVGFVIAAVIISAAQLSDIEIRPDYETTAIIWLILGALALFGPSIVSVRNLGLSLMNTRMVLAFIGAGLAAYDIIMGSQESPEEDGIVTPINQGSESKNKTADN